MKALVIDNKIVSFFNQLPKEWKNYLNFDLAEDDITQSEGFYDVIIPEYDPNTYRLGELFFDEVNQVVTYTLIEIPISEVKEKLLSDFEDAKQRTRLNLLEALVDKLVEINRELLPPGLVGLYDALIAENARVIAAIDYMAVNDPAALRKFRIIPEDVENFVAALSQYKL